ncbi:MAG: prenyltransferase [Clostridiaceae bacterium]|jgi:1,4-dihydroxy-2-naphthoate polyprenyltransferase|nr:prenyltransferase [Clostridiaceae bacterium]
MSKIGDKIVFWISNSRPFSLPMTIMSWLVIFLFSIKEGGCILNGILALVGILFAHLATNLVDDFIDYKALSKNPEFAKIVEKSKFAYLTNGQASVSELKQVILVYCAIATIIGLILFLNCGIEVVFLALVGAAIVLSYPMLSNKGFGEIAVGIAFGPLLFEGVYFVMTGYFSWIVFFLSIAVVSFTTILLFINNFLDYDRDIQSGKVSFCTRLGQQKSLDLLYCIALKGYAFMFLTAILTKNPMYLISYLSIPLVIFLRGNLAKYIENKTAIPNVKWWNLPLGDWNTLVKNGTAPFYFSLLSARNIAMWFMILTCIAIIV